MWGRNNSLFNFFKCFKKWELYCSSMEMSKVFLHSFADYSRACSDLMAGYIGFTVTQSWWFWWKHYLFVCLEVLNREKSNFCTLKCRMILLFLWGLSSFDSIHAQYYRRKGDYTPLPSWSTLPINFGTTRFFFFLIL